MQGAPPFPGLQNLGNTCFLNTALQALASCPSFIEYLNTAVAAGQQEQEAAQQRGRAAPFEAAISSTPAFAASSSAAWAAATDPTALPSPSLSPPRGAAAALVAAGTSASPPAADATREAVPATAGTWYEAPYRAARLAAAAIVERVAAILPTSLEHPAGPAAAACTAASPAGPPDIPLVLQLQECLTALQPAPPPGLVGSPAHPQPGSSSTSTSSSSMCAVAQPPALGAAGVDAPQEGTPDAITLTHHTATASSSRPCSSYPHHRGSVPCRAAAGGGGPRVLYSPAGVRAALLQHLPAGELALGEQHDAAEALQALVAGVTAEMQALLGRTAAAAGNTTGSSSSGGSSSSSKGLAAACNLQMQQPHLHLALPSLIQPAAPVGDAAKVALQNTQAQKLQPVAVGSASAAAAAEGALAAVNSITAVDCSCECSCHVGQHHKQQQQEEVQQQEQQQQQHLTDHHQQQQWRQLALAPCEGLVAYPLTCTTCGHQFTTSLQRFSVLALPVPSASSRGSRGWAPTASPFTRSSSSSNSVALEACLQQLLRPQLLSEVVCERCSLAAAVAAGQQQEDADGQQPGRPAGATATGAPAPACRGNGGARHDSQCAVEVAADSNAHAAAADVTGCLSQPTDAGGVPVPAAAVSPAVKQVKAEDRAAASAAGTHNSQPASSIYSKEQLLAAAAAAVKRSSCPLPALPWEVHLLQDCHTMRRRVLQQLRLVQLPAVLLLQLGRALHGGRGAGADKVGTHVQFPQVLDMTAYVGLWDGAAAVHPRSARSSDGAPCSAASQSEGRQQGLPQQQQQQREQQGHGPSQGLVYDLVAVGQHIGGGSSGHYQLYRRTNRGTSSNPSSVGTAAAAAAASLQPEASWQQQQQEQQQVEWWLVSDSLVRASSWGEVCRVEASLLVYERCR